MSAHRKKREQGSTLIGGLILILLLSMFGASLVQSNAEDTASGSDTLNTQNALYAGLAGMEYASRRIDYGYDPGGTSMNFGKGNFSIATNPQSGLATVTSTSGIAKKVQSFTRTFSRNCCYLDTSGAYIDHNDLFGVKLVKTCNSESVVSRILFTCNPTNAATKIKFIKLESTTIYNPGSVGSPGGGGASLAEWIDVVDYLLAPNQSYKYDYVFSGNPKGIEFSKPPAGNGSCTMTVEFLDGSQSSGSF